MNVFKFYILVEAKSSINSISQEITNTYASKTAEAIDYKKRVARMWNELGKENIVALYPSSALLVCCVKARCKYFFADTNKSVSDELHDAHYIHR